jgi:GNAT superfamily N-acetyltransferase
MQESKEKLPYRIVDINAANIDELDILCLKSKKDSEGYGDKVRWVKDSFKEGLRLKLLLVEERRGRLKERRSFTSRGFIEYIPGEYTWRGIEAKGYMVIHCIWVVGRIKGQGLGSKLLAECLKDAKGMKGVAVVTTERTWLPRKDLFVKNGFTRADAMPPYLELYAKRFSENAELPRFKPIPKARLDEYPRGITIFKSDQCPYTAASTRVISETAKEFGIPVRIEHIKDYREAQNNVHPYGTFCIMLDGKVLTYRPIGRKDFLEYTQRDS